MQICSPKASNLMGLEEVQIAANVGNLKTNHFYQVATVEPVSLSQLRQSEQPPELKKVKGHLVTAEASIVTNAESLKKTYSTDIVTNAIAQTIGKEGCLINKRLNFLRWKDASIWIDRALTQFMFIKERFEALQINVLKQVFCFGSHAKYVMQKKWMRITMTIQNHWKFAGYAENITMNIIETTAKAFCLKI